MSLATINIRQLQPSDNPVLANIIRRSLEEFGANQPGTAYFDEMLDRLSEQFTKKNSWYFVVEKEGTLLGGAGIYPTDGLPELTCELVKMYLAPEARGTGLGKLLLQECLSKAKSLGYRQVYLETMPQLINAIPLYKNFGFEMLDAPLGNSGHYGCPIQMLKIL